MTQPLLGRNYLEFLDEKIARGENTWPDASYPPLTAEEKRVLKVVAEGICVSQYAIQWAYYEGLRGDDKGWKRIREKLLSKPVKLITRAL